MHVISGFVIDNGGIEQSINEEFAISSATGWRGFVNNNGGSDDTFEVWAICAKATYTATDPFTLPVRRK
jgi:hypothetical protein